MWESITDAFAHTRDQLFAEPSLWLCLTLLAYAFGMWTYKKSGYKTIFTPLLVAIVVLASLLLMTGTPYKTYMEGGQHINFLLGPATVALAVPLYEQRLRLAKMWFPLLCGLVSGGTVAIVSAVLIAGALKVGALLAGASEEDLQPLYEYGTKIGLAFQLQDDLLDLYGDEAKFGKKLGSDIRENKKTYLYIKALELLEEVDAIALEHEFSTPTLPFGDIAKIKKVKALYEKVKVKDHCEKAVGNLFAEAGEALDRLSASPAVDPQALSALRAFGSELLGREV